MIRKFLNHPDKTLCEFYQNFAEIEQNFLVNEDHNQYKN